MAQAWNLQQAGHLLRRATFGFTADRLYQALGDGPEKTIDLLLAPPAGYAAFEESLAAIAPREASPRESAQLALYRMLHSPYPLREKAVFEASTPARLAEQLRTPAYRQKVKSPLELALNLAIAFDVPLAPAQLQGQVAALGQSLEGPALAQPRWLNAFTVVGRSNLAASILARVERFPERRILLDALLQNDASPAVLQGLAGFEGRDLAQAIANLPEFQLI